MNELLDAALSMVWKFGIFIIAFAALIAFIKIKVIKLERRLADKRRRERRERKTKERRGE